MVHLLHRLYGVDAPDASNGLDIRDLMAFPTPAGFYCTFQTVIYHIQLLSVEESIRMTEDRDKWRMYVHGVANPRIVDG